MLYHRCMSKGARLIAPDILGGMHTPDEISNNGQHQPEGKEGLLARAQRAQQVIEEGKAKRVSLNPESYDPDNEFSEDHEPDPSIFDPVGEDHEPGVPDRELTETFNEAPKTIKSGAEPTMPPMEDWQIKEIQGLYQKLGAYGIGVETIKREFKEHMGLDTLDDLRVNTADVWIKKLKEMLKGDK